MADTGRSSDRPPRSPLKTKVVRAHKISAAVSPTDRRSDEPDDEPVPLPRSHTPGQLASKSSHRASQDRRRKPSADSSAARHRSQSASVVPAQAPPPRPATAGSHARSSNININNSNNSNNGDSPRDGDADDRDRRRLMVMRSTSAIAARPTPTPASSGSPAATPPATAPPSVEVQRSRQGRGDRDRDAAARAAALPIRQPAKYAPFPPLQHPNDAPDVPPAPSSGMYWSKALASGAPHTALRAHTTTLIGSNIYVFGGCDARTCFNTLYVLDADSFHWSVPHVVGDAPGALRAMTCTAVGKKLVVFGGGDGPAYYNDVYVLDTVNFRWSRPRILGDRLPSKRRAHTACLYKNGIYVFGGGDGVRALNDVWRLDVSDTSKMSWKLVNSADTAPPGTRDHRPKARGYHTANMVGSKLIIFGGSDGGECFDDIWVYDVDTHVWKAAPVPVTFRRLSHTATIIGSYLFVVGGHDGNEYSSDTLLLNLVTMAWDKRRVYGLPPSGRGYHGAVLYDSRLVIVGGFDGSEVFGDVMILELAVHAYYSQISHFTIEV